MIATACGKRTYATMAGATRAMRETRETNRRRGDEGEMHVYRCDDCGDYHVGHVDRWGLKYFAYLKGGAR